jgi:hypothetical protein
MHSNIASEIWGELKRFVNTVDREEAADVLVSLLIDNDEDPDDIKSAFKGDSDVKHALTAYMDQGHDESEDDEEDYDEADFDDSDEEEY